MPQKKPQKKPDIPNQVIDAALALAVERGWRGLALADIAEAAKLPLSQVYSAYSSKAAILRGFTRRIDAAVLAEEEADAREGNARDRLFDVLMRRFDALKPHREALGNIAFDEARDPVSALCGLGRLERSMAAMLEAARLSAGGLRGLLRAKALGLAYLATLRVFLRDDSPDLAATMAALDRNLSRLDRLARGCSRSRYATAATAE
ncbi:MAG: TetR family transcriptional regulator [Alphaproteobacteria bacterium]